MSHSSLDRSATGDATAENSSRLITNHTTAFNFNDVVFSRFLQASQTLQTISKKLSSGRESQEIYLEGITNPSVKAMFMAGLLEQQARPIVVLCADPQSTTRYFRDLIELLPSDKTAIWPSEEFSPYDQSNLPVRTAKEQFLIGNSLKLGDAKIYLIPARSLVLKHLSLTRQEELAITVQVNDRLSPQDLATLCLERGYLKTGIILEPGEFSSRGDIFDLFPVQGEPVRIEFFGDTVESIRVINAETQRSIESVKTVTAIPKHSLTLTENHQEKLTQAIYRQYDAQVKGLEDVEAEALKATIDTQMQAFKQQGLIVDGLDYYTPLVEDEIAFQTVLDLLPSNALLVLDNWLMTEQVLEGYCDRLTRQYEEGKQKGRLLDLGFQYHLGAPEALGQLKDILPQRLFLDAIPLTPDENKLALRMDVEAPPHFKADLRVMAETVQTYRRDGFRVFVSTDNPQRVIDNCKEAEVPAEYLSEKTRFEETLKYSQGAFQDILVSKTGLSEGFILPEAKLVYITDAELFNRKRKKAAMFATSGHKRDDADVIKAIDELREGDYVVHYKHGIGRFERLNKIDIDGEVREYLTVQYAGQDKLHVPVEQVNLLSRYRGSGDVAPKLNKMGGFDWGKTKSKAEKAIQSIARELMELYAARARSRGFQFEPDTPWQVEMEESFPYTETPDQWQAIQDVKLDMESDQPMDRLICGDVGYGKTEVAIRSIFKAVLSGRQVAVLVPTTILAQQHFTTIADRFKPYPVRVGLLSRFRTPKEQKEVLNRVAIGECDVVVGTHRLLQKDVHFKDLGLVVVDEEHRFGVSHKEKLKQLRKNVDVLVMSATPIPRTLHMAISGIRQMSLINTPPVNRSPIQTYVGPYNPAQVRMAILQEVDRGGQVYFLHNRVQSIYAMQQHLNDLVPEVRVGVGHGQMNERDLEAVMLSFAQGEYDVLLCTTIIESGVDIPNANTMIIDRADRFGLAQLYQIRGRVGRSDIQAYAYCYYDPEKMITQDAQERLRAIREFTQLGSGYQIALRDMEIRGVGNVLGSEQHGHMVAVGFDLYCQMLEENIQALQGKHVEHQQDSVVDLNVTAFIPDTWMNDKNLKLTEYKRLADIRSNRALDIIQSEWQDRFGDIPEQTQTLVRLVKLRILATELGIPVIRENDEELRFYVHYGLQDWMTLQAKMPPDIGKIARWLPPATAKEGSTPILAVKQLSLRRFDKLEFVERFLTALGQLPPLKT
jgi:transcription-repair coupling factor (superfamily II helicase)